MIRNKAYFSVMGPANQPGLPNIPDPSTVNAIATWGDTTGITLNDSTFTLTNLFSIKDSSSNNIISIDSDTVYIGSSQVNMKVPNILYYGLSMGNLQLGASNLENNTNGDNCAYGHIALNSLDNTNGSSNNTFGNQSMQNANINCYQNNCFGTSSGRFMADNCTGNICIGFYTGSGLISSSNYNVYCGHFNELMENQVLFVWVLQITITDVM